MKDLPFFLSFFCFLFLCNSLYSQAGDDRLDELKGESLSKDTVEGWVTGGSFGLDLSQLLFYQPQIGAGQNRFAFGTLAAIFANYDRGRVAWDNLFSIQLAIQKLGDDPNDEFSKLLDQLRLESKYGYQLEGNWYAAIEGGVATQLLPTYEGSYLSAPTDTAIQLSGFFSPANMYLAPGIDYKPSENLSLFLSPVALRVIYVADDDIAQLGVHGNDLEDEERPELGYKNSSVQLGARFSGTYKDQLMGENLLVYSNLVLFSNYLEDAKNIDMIWRNDVGWRIWKNLSLNLLVDLFYDDDITLQKDTNDDNVYDPETDNFGPGLSITESLLVKYSIVF